MRLNRVGKTFILFLAFTFTISNWISPVLADELQGNTPDCFDFSVLASVDDEKYAHWLDLVEYNDEWYISAENACYFSGFTSWTVNNGLLELSRPRFYNEWDVPVPKTDYTARVIARTIKHNGIDYYEFNSTMDCLRTRVSYATSTNLVIFETCKVFPNEFSVFCCDLTLSTRFYLDAPDEDDPLTQITVNFVADLKGFKDYLTGKDTDEMKVLKSILETPAITDPDMSDYFHIEKKHKDAFAKLNKIYGYVNAAYDFSKKSGNPVFIYLRDYGHVYNTVASGIEFTNESRKLYRQIYDFTSSGGRNEIRKVLENNITPAAGESNTSAPTPVVNAYPVASLATWDAYDQWQKTKDWETVYVNAMKVVFTGDSYDNCPTELKSQAESLIVYYDMGDFAVVPYIIEDASSMVSTTLIKNSVAAPYLTLIEKFDKHIGALDAISEVHQTYIVNEIQKQCRYKMIVPDKFPIGQADPNEVLQNKYSAIFYLRSYMYACKLWEDGSALNKYLISGETNPFSDLTDDDISNIKKHFTREIDSAAPILAQLIQVRDEDLLDNVQNIIGYADRNGDLIYYDSYEDELVTINIHYYHHNTHDYDGILEELDVGSHFYYGSYEQDNNLENGPEPIEWVVTSVDGDSVEAQSFYILDSHLFKNKMWFSSELRKWCNHEFLSTAFADYEQTRLEYMQYRGGLNDESQSAKDDFSSVDRVLLLSTGAAQSTDYAVRDGDFEDRYWRSGVYYSSAWGERGHSYINNQGKEDSLFYNGTTYAYSVAYTTSYGIRPVVDISFNAENDAKDNLIKNAAPGDIVVLGYDELDGDPDNGKEEIDWIVMGRKDDKLLLETYYPINGISNQKYSEWRTSELRQWLNGDFYNDCFNDQDKEYIVTATLRSAYGYATEDYFFPQEGFARYLEYFNYSYISNNYTRCTRSGITNPITVCTILSIDGKSPEPHKNDEMYSYEKTDLTDSSKTYHIGDSIFLGNYEQDMISSDGRESIEWVVIGFSGSNAVLISKYCLDYLTIGYDEYTGRRYPENLRTWANTYFYSSAFTEEEKTFLTKASFLAGDGTILPRMPKGDPTRKALVTEYAYYQAINNNRSFSYTSISSGKYNSNPFTDPATVYSDIGTTYGAWWVMSTTDRTRMDENGEYIDGNNAQTSYYARPAIWIYLPETLDVSNETEFIAALTDTSERTYTINIVSDFTISQDYSELTITHGDIQFNGHTITIDRKGNGDFFYFGSSDSVRINLDGGEENGSAIWLDPSYSYFMLRDRHSTINNIKIYIGESEQTITPTPAPTQEFAMYDCYPLEVVYDCPTPHSVGETRTIILTNKSDVEITSWAIEMTFEDAIASKSCKYATFDESDENTIILRNNKNTGTIAPNESVTVTLILKGASNNPKQPTEVKLYDVSPTFATSHALTLGQVENGTASLSAKTAYAGDVITVTTEPQAGYELDSITVNNQPVTGNTFVMPDEDVSIEVKFKKTDYTITVNNTVNGTVSASKTTANIGDEIVLTVNPAAGYELDSIKVNDEIINGTTFIMADSNVVVEITYKIINYTITVSETSNGSVSAANTSANYGEVIQLTVSPDAGYKIDTIKVNGNPISGNSFTMPAEDVVIEAVFEKINYTVTINYAPNGIVSASKNTANYGDEIVLTITPDSGYELDYIKINGDVIEDPSFVMPAGDVTVDVGFKVLVIKNGWELEDGKYYYYQNNKKVTGWVKSGASWYYMDPEDGVMVTGWKFIGGLWYFMAQSGAMQIGWVKSGNSWYYLTPGSGHMVTGWKEIGGKWYYFASSGAMVTNWIDIGGTWYYMDSSGAMVTGWKEISGKWYYFAPSGDMQTGWKYLGGEWYYLRESGDMVTGWEKIDEKWYYFYSSGAMAHGTTIDGYEISDSGAMV